MPGVHVIRDKDTHIAKVFWPNHDPAIGQVPPAIEENKGPNDEYVFFPNMNYETIHELARRSVAGEEGVVYETTENTKKKDIRWDKVRIGRDGVWAEPPTRRPQGLVGELEELRQSVGKKADEPLTFGDIEKASQKWKDDQQERIQARREENEERAKREPQFPITTSRSNGWRRANYTRVPGYVDRSNVGIHIPALQQFNAEHIPHAEGIERERIEPADLHPLKTFVSQGLRPTKTEEENELARQIVKTFAPEQDVNPEELVNNGHLPEIVAEIVRVFGPQLEDS